MLKGTPRKRSQLRWYSWQLNSPSLHVKLKQHVTRRQRHLIDFSRIPCADDQAPAFRIGFYLRNQIIDLIDVHSVSAAPIPPLRAINAAKLAVFVSPFIPDRDAVFVQVANVGVAAQKPEQLVNDRFQVQLFGCQQRKPRPVCAQIESGLRTKDR